MREKHQVCSAQLFISTGRGKSGQNQAVINVGHHESQGVCCSIAATHLSWERVTYCRSFLKLGIHISTQSYYFSTPLTHGVFLRRLLQSLTRSPLDPILQNSTAIMINHFTYAVNGSPTLDPHDPPRHRSHSTSYSAPAAKAPALPDISSFAHLFSKLGVAMSYS